jgi:hypothetical protein
MADEPNKSNKGPINSLDDIGFSEIERIGRRAGRHTAEDIAQRIRISQASSRIQQYQAALESGPSEDIARLLGRELAHERKMMNTLEPRIEMRAEKHRQRVIDLTQSAIGRAFDPSSVNGQSTEIARSGLGQRMALGMMRSSYEDLESRRAGVTNQISGLGKRAEALSEELYNERGQQDPAKVAELQNIYRQRNRLVNYAGGIEAAQRQMRSMGLDPQSRIESLFSAGERAQRAVSAQEISRQLASGSGEFGGKSLQDLRQQEVTLSQQLIQQLDRLKDSAGKSAEEINKMRESAEKTAEQLEKTQEAISQTGGGNMRGGTYGALNLLAGGFGAIGQAFQQIGVSQRIGERANIAGYAGIENQKYATYKAAAAGDVASQLMLSQFAAAETFGRDIKSAAQVSLTAYAAGSATQIAAGGVRAYEAALQKANPAAYATGTSTQNSIALMQGAQDVIQGAASTAIIGADIARGVTPNQSAIAAIQADLQARRAIMAVSAEQLQGFRDFGVGMGAAAIGMGRAGGAFVNQAVSNTTLNQMVSSRISPEQMAQMATFGAQQIGSTFGMSQIFAARGLERSGFGTIQENMQRMAALAGAGANNPEKGLGSVLEAAFSKSLDGSKALNMVVENTAAMVESSSARQFGIDTTSAAAQILVSGVNEKDPNKEFAIKQAMTAEQRLRQIGTNTGVDFSGMSAVARISRATGLSGVESIIAQSIDDQTLVSLKKGGRKEAFDYFSKMGINVQQQNVGTLIENLMKARTATLFEAGGSGLAVGLDVNYLTQKRQQNARYEDLDPKQKQLLAQTAQLARIAGGGEELYRRAGAFYETGPNKLIKETAEKAIKGELGTDQQKMLDEMRTQGFKQLSQAALEATKGFNSATDALKALGNLAKEVEKIGDVGGEGKFKTAAADAAGTFGKSTMQFEKSVENFSRAVSQMMTRSGISSADSGQAFIDDLIKRESKKINTLKY